MDFVLRFLILSLEICYTITSSFFNAIFIFTFLSKIFLLPISLWTHLNSLKMVSLMPALNRLQVKYYGDKDQIAEETQHLYKQQGYHPLLSTVPMFLQLALLIGVIGAVRELLAGTESILSVYPSQVGGITLLMPLAAGLSALLLGLAQNRLNPLQREQTKASQWTTNGVSIAISLMLGAFVPMGVGVYWIASNLLTIAQQLLLNAVMPPKRYVDYEALAESRKELDKLNSLSAKVSPEDKRREKADYKRFFSVANKHLVFYSEKSGFYKYFADVIDYLLAHSNLTIHYITSDPQDAIFEKAKTEPHIRPYYIGEKRLITLMMKMDADMVVMTMPDLDNFHIKRSYVRKDIEYIFMFHWATSTHMVIREHSLDHYDTIFCPGPYQMEEIRIAEKLDSLPPKKLVETSYGVIERLTEAYAGMEKTQNPIPQILIAPSYQTDNIMDSCIDDLLEQLLKKEYRLILRPHPQYIKRYPQKIEAFQQRYQHEIEAGDLEFQLDFSSGNTVYCSDIVITDWSTIAYEFSMTTGKPSLFVDTPMKVINQNYMRYPMQPLDIALREKIGHSVKLSELERVQGILADMVNDPERWKDQIMAIKWDLMPKFGQSGELGGKYILQELLAHQKRKA